MHNFHPDFLGEAARRIALKTYPRARQFVVQHLYPDTLRLLMLLHEHVPIHCIIGIGYSGNDEVVGELKAAGIRVVTPSFADIHTTVEAELARSLAYCEEQQLELVIHEVGGYAIKSLHEKFEASIPTVLGAIEVTKQGVWVAEALPVLKIPQLNCAQTRLKEVEGKMVGEAVVAALDNILRELGYAMVGRPAAVAGYGWVGKGTVHSLAKRGMHVTVMDTDVIKLVDAAVDGYAIAQNPNDIGTPHIIIGATGYQSINADIIDSLPNRSFIVSGASKNHETDLAHLESITLKKYSIHPHVDAHEVKGNKTLFLVNKGYPVNFTGSSVPDEIVEFLFCELIMLVQELLDHRPAPGIYPLKNDLEEIAAQIWLDLR